MKKILLIFIIIFILCGCGQTKMEKYKQIMEDSQYVIIDVRTNTEYNEKHVVGAINIPYDEIDENVNIDKNTVVFVYCKSGNRSKYAYEVLVNLGYTTYDMGAFDEIDLPKE